MSALEGVLSFVTGGQPRGLHNFISEIRGIEDIALERQRVDKELGNIRQKFSNSSALSAYQKKKYIWKLCYIYMLGYEVDFGHVEFISLLSAPTFVEKQVGYMAVGLLLRPDDQMMGLVYNSLRNDLASPIVHSKTLALTAIANLGGEEMASHLGQEVKAVLRDMLQGSTRHLQHTYGGAPPTPISNAEILRSSAAVMKRACLASLRLYRANPESAEPAEWLPILSSVLAHDDLGLLTSAMALTTALASYNTSVFESIVPQVVTILTRLVIDSKCSDDYTYYRVPCPWLQVRCLRFLQYFKEPTGQQWSTLSSVLLRILTRGQVEHDSINIQNIQYALVFEAIALVVSWGPSDPRGEHYELREMTHKLLGGYIAVSDANVKYLALDMLTRVAKVDGVDAGMQAYQHTVVASLSDADMSVRKRALEVMFLITDAANATSVVAELVAALASADEQLREDMVVKIAILAERFYENIRWYVDTMVEVIIVAGSFVAEGVWHHIVQTIINNVEVHEYAAQKLFNSVQSKFCQEVCICLAAYILGEVGFHISDKPGCSGFEQFAALHQHFELVGAPSKAILLTCYIKLSNQYPDVTADVQSVFTKMSTSSTLELQQRACEYASLPTQGPEMMQAILEAMPQWQVKAESVLQTMVGDKEAEKSTSDKAAWKVSTTEKEESRKQAITATAAAAAAVGTGRGGAVGGGSAASSRSPTASSSSSSSGSADKWAPSTGSAAPKPATPAPVDLLSLEGDSSSSSAAAGGGSFSASGSSGSSGALTDAEKESVRRNLQHALVAGTNKCVLFESDVVSVGCAADFRGAQARLVLTVSNKTAGELQDVTVDVQQAFEGDYLAVKVIPPQSNKVGSLDEIKVQIALACRKPWMCTWADYPTCTVRYRTSNGNARVLALHLPAAPASFSEALVCDKADYMNRYRALDPPAGQQEQEVFTLGASIGTITDVVIAKLRANLMPKLKIGCVADIDTANTITGSTSFKTNTAGPDGQPISVEAYVRLEADRANGRMRVTVRCKQQKVAKSLVMSLKGQLM